MRFVEVMDDGDVVCGVRVPAFVGDVGVWGGVVGERFGRFRRW